MDHNFEQISQSSSGLPLQMTAEDKEAFSEVAEFEDITQEQKDEFLALLWEIACCATLIHFGVHPIQSLVGKRNALATQESENVVE